MKIAFCFQARKAIAFYHAKKPDAPEVEEELTVCLEAVSKKTVTKQKQDATPQKKVNQVKDEGFRIIFNPFTARDARSRVIRMGAWIGVMVKVRVMYPLLSGEDKEEKKMG